MNSEPHVHWVGCRSLALAVAALWTATAVSVRGDGNYRVFGRIVDGATSTGIGNVEVQLYYVPLASTTDDQTTLAIANTDVNGAYSFEALPGELEGHVRILQLPTSYVAPVKETVRLSKLNPTNEVVFRAGPSATLAGTIVITNGTADLTKFTVEVNATEVDVAANGSVTVSDLPAYQQTARLIYQDDHYFDERVISLPAMTPGQTTTAQFQWHKPMNTVSTEGYLRDAQNNVLPSALIQFLGQATGVFVGMKTDGSGFYRIYDLPDDCYAVRAFVGRWGVEQRTLKSSDAVFCTGSGGNDSDGDGMPDGWELQYGLNPSNPSDAAQDLDNDGVSNLDEYRRGTDPTDPLSKNVTLYANSSTGNNSYDGLRPTVADGHGPKHNIQPAIAAAISGDSIEIAAGAYAETTFNPQSKTLTLRPIGTVTIP